MNVPKLKSIYLPFDPGYPSLPYGSASIEISHGPVEFSMRVYHKPHTSLKEFARDLELLERELLAAAAVIRKSINAVKA